MDGWTGEWVDGWISELGRTYINGCLVQRKKEGKECFIK